ncbi:LPS export ABC transporter periplasmic protein LptC [Salinarimonas sp.]|uniref:LPS export ABC transporter periplasmic protein LptC n=1 Tax=Salinarimonas sp. TaxID=2766526 RepID=UPI0032D92BE7
MHADHAEARAPIATRRPAPSDRGRRSYARALRHSRRVRFLKIAIPVGAVGAVALVVAITLFNPFASVGGLSIGPVNVSGTRIVMDSPRMSGFQDDTRPYEVTASEASQDVREPHLVDLLDLRARVTADDRGNIVSVEAAKGRFDTQSEILVLNENVRVTSTLGYTADLATATIDFGAGTVVSDRPVRVGTDFGLVEAEGLSLSDGGEVITFTGGVRSTFNLRRSGSRGGP